MKNEILDAPEKEYYNAYSKKAFRMFWIAALSYGLLICTSLFLQVNRSYNAESIVFSTTLGLLAILGGVISIFGMIYSILSFYKKEKNTFKKWIALIGNLIFFSILALILYANLLDIIRGLS